MKTNRRAPKTLSPTHRSLALLAALPPKHSAALAYSSAPWHKSHRLVQLRANVLLIFTRGAHAAAADLSNVDKAVLLDPETPLTAPSPTSIQLGKHRLTLDTPARATLLRNAITAAQAASSELYTVRAEIGHGASGTVHLATRRSDGKPLAVKTIAKSDTLVSNARLQELVSERLALQSAAARGSPFIVRLVDAFETRSHLCLVTELGEFGDLFSLLHRLPAKRVPERVARHMFADVVLGLEESHRMGFLYRDMKPGNLLLTASGHVKVADFGLAKRVEVEEDFSSVSSESDSSGEEEEGEMRLVGRTKSFVGTRRYMSPELITSWEETSSGYGAASDVWALGVTLFVLLTGRHPFAPGVSSGNSGELFWAIGHEKVEYPEWLSEEVVWLLRGMLERDTAQRVGISEIKSHAWLKNVDWAEVRERGNANSVQEEVVRFVSESGVQSVGKKVAFWEGSSSVSDASSASSQSRSAGSERVMSSASSNHELLGFGYMEQM